MNTTHMYGEQEHINMELDRLDGCIDHLENVINDIGSDVSCLKGLSSGLSQHVEELQHKADDHDNALRDAVKEIEHANSSCTDNSTAMNEFEFRLSQIEEFVDELDARLEALELVHEEESTAPQLDASSSSDVGNLLKSANSSSPLAAVRMILQVRASVFRLLERVDSLHAKVDILSKNVDEHSARLNVLKNNCSALMKDFAEAEHNTAASFKHVHDVLRRQEHDEHESLCLQTDLRSMAIRLEKLEYTVDHYALVAREDYSEENNGAEHHFSEITREMVLSAAANRLS